MRPVICFDWDGTLCDSMELCIHENAATLRAMGLPAKPERVLRACNGPSFEEAAPMLGIPPDRLEEYCRVRLGEALKLVPQVNRLFPGAKALLTELKEKADLCVVSNGTAAYLELCMRQFGLEGVFTRIVSSRPGRTKTDNLAALLRDLRPEKAVMVGDRLGDILAGKNNGLPTVAAAFGYGSDAEYAQAEYRVNTMAELLDWLKAFIRE